MLLKRRFHPASIASRSVSAFFSIVLAVMACDGAAQILPPTRVDAHSQTIVIFLPSDSEIAALTTRDLTIQEFLAYKLDIEERVKREFPGVALIVTSTDVIATPDATVTRTPNTHRFGFVIYSPGRGTRLFDGIVNPDVFMHEVTKLFDTGPISSTPSPPSPAPIPGGERPASSPRTSTIREPTPLYCGRWRGSAKRRALFARAYSVIIDLDAGIPGAQVGTVDYPEASCHGTLKLRRSNPTGVLLEENIISGPCERNGSIELTTAGKDFGQWRWLDSDGRERASAILAHTDLPVPSAGSEMSSAGAPLPMPAPRPRMLGESQTSNFSSFVGTWRGNVRQFLAPPYTLTMQLTSDQIGTAAGFIAYPEFGCRGRLTLIEHNGDQVRLAEKIEVGKCVDSGTIVFSAGGRSAGRWEWYDDRGRRRATAQLTRAANANATLPLNEATARANSAPKLPRNSVTRPQLQEQFGKKMFLTKMRIGNALVNNDHNFRSSTGQFVTGVSRSLVDTNVFSDGSVVYNLTSTIFDVYIKAYDVSPACGPNRSEVWVSGDWGNTLQNVSLCEIRSGSEVMVVSLSVKDDRLDFVLSAQGVYAKLKFIFGKDWQKTMDLDGVKNAVSRVLSIE